MLEPYEVEMLTDDNGGFHPYRYIGGPLENPSHYPDLFQALGEAAMAWARMEQHVDAILVQLNKADHSPDLTPIYNPRHPKPFFDKLELLGDYFNKHPALARYKDAVTDFRMGLSGLAPERNFIFHGILEDFDEKAGEYVINKMTPLGGKVTTDFSNRRERGSIEVIHSFTRCVNLAHYGLCEISKDLFTREAVTALRTPGAQILRWSDAHQDQLDH